MADCNVVVLISGSGSNLQAILDACVTGQIRGRVSGVLSSQDGQIAAAGVAAL